MSRLVTYNFAKPPSPAIGEAVANAANEDPKKADDGKTDAYIQRVAKFIPVEIVGFFVFVNALLKGEVESGAIELIGGDQDAGTVSDLLAEAAETAQLAGFISVSAVSWIAVGLCIVLIPIYLWFSRDESEEGEWPVLTIVMALLAFPVWAYAVEAVAFRPYYDGTLAAIALAIFTVISGAVSPALIEKLRGAAAG